MYDCAPVFSNSLTNVLVEELGYHFSDVVDLLNKSGVISNDSTAYPNWKLLQQWLNQSGAQNKWNDVFDNKRASFIADWVRPFINGATVLDLLCGNGRIGNILSAEFKVSFMEHFNHYGLGVENYNGAVYNFNSRDVALDHIDVVMIIASLHHELKPKEAIEYAVRIAKKRIIVIENTITALYDHNYQVMIDHFFNACLNESNLPNPGNHHTAKEWIDMIEAHGAKLINLDYRSRIPGIPMPHDLMVFDV